VTDPRPLHVLTPTELGIILALEPVLQDPTTHLTLVCPVCVRDGHAWLDTDNSPTDAQWKVDCRCRRRRATRRTDVGASPSHWGDLLWAAQAILPPALLAVRCRTSRCRTRPMEIRAVEDGWLVTCDCSRMTFRTHLPHSPAPAAAPAS